MAWEPARAHNGDATPVGQVNARVNGRMDQAVADAAPQTGESRLLGGRLRLVQPKRGYRAGMDAALLAAAVTLKPGERALEIGCGAGGALLQAAVRNPEAALAGVERDPATLILAEGNIARNGLADRVTAMAGVVSGGFRALGQGRVDLAFANPPFFDDPRALRTPAPERVGAWMADDGLAAWLSFLIDAVKDGGRVVAIHRADRLADLLAGLAPRAGSIRIRPIQPQAEAPAKRVLVWAVRGGKAPLVLLPALVLHDRSGAKHTPHADAILKGEATLGWEL